MLSISDITLSNDKDSRKNSNRITVPSGCRTRLTLFIVGLICTFLLLYVDTFLKNEPVTLWLAFLQVSSFRPVVKTGSKPAKTSVIVKLLF